MNELLAKEEFWFLRCAVERLPSLLVALLLL